ncbi:hypothetical protein EMIT0P176_210067 [Pseudomonas sp. IT-P176]
MRSPSPLPHRQLFRFNKRGSHLTLFAWILLF